MTFSHSRTGPALGLLWCCGTVPFICETTALTSLAVTPSSWLAWSSQLLLLLDTEKT